MAESEERTFCHEEKMTRYNGELVKLHKGRG